MLTKDEKKKEYSHTSKMLPFRWPSKLGDDAYLNWDVYDRSNLIVILFSS